MSIFQSHFEFRCTLWPFKVSISCSCIPSMWQSYFALKCTFRP